MKTNAAAAPGIGSTGTIPGVMGGAAPKPAIPPVPEGEKPSLAKVLDLLKQATDMVTKLGGNDQVGAVAPPMPAAPPPARSRATMRPAPKSLPPIV